MSKIKNYLIVIFFLTGNLQAKSQNADIEILRVINLDRNQSLDAPMGFLSATTIYPVIGVPVVLTAVGIMKKNNPLRNKGLEIAASGMATQIITFSMKAIIKRPRPYITYPELENLYVDQDASFPSGHTSNSFSLATSLSLNFPVWYIIAPSYLWASSVAYSRMHIGVHYPSDVAVGCLVGTGTAFITHIVNKKLQKVYAKPVIDE